MDPLLIAFRLIHVVAGILWVGFAVFVPFYLSPALAEAGPDSAKVMAALQRPDAERPRLIIGVPVGFVDAAESKQALYETAAVPWITALGRKGGSTVAAAVVNALLEWVTPDRATTEPHHG